MDLTDFAVRRFAFRFGDDGSYTLRYRLRDIPTPVRLMTDHRHKEIPRRRHAAVQGHLPQSSRRQTSHPRSEKVAQITICHLFPLLD